MSPVSSTAPFVYSDSRTGASCFHLTVFRTVFKYLLLARVQLQLLVVERVIMNALEEEGAHTPSKYLPSVVLNTLPVCVLVIDYLIPPSLLLRCSLASSPLRCEHQVHD